MARKRSSRSSPHVGNQGRKSAKRGRGKGDIPPSSKRAIELLRKRRAEVGTAQLAIELGIPEPSLRRILSTGRLGRVDPSPAIRAQVPGSPAGGKSRPSKTAEKNLLSPRPASKKEREAERRTVEAEKRAAAAEKRAAAAEKRALAVERREQARERKRARDRRYQERRRNLRREIRRGIREERYFGREGARDLAREDDLSERVFWTEFRREYRRKGK